MSSLLENYDYLTDSLQINSLHKLGNFNIPVLFADLTHDTNTPLTIKTNGNGICYISGDIHVGAGGLASDTAIFKFPQDRLPNFKSDIAYVITVSGGAFLVVELVIKKDNIFFV